MLDCTRVGVMDHKTGLTLIQEVTFVCVFYNTLKAMLKQAVHL